MYHSEELPAPDPEQQGAHRVHGISIEHLSEHQAPTFDVVATRRRRLDDAAVICIYNSGFYVAALKTSAECAGDSGDWEEGPARDRHGKHNHPRMVARW